MFLSLLDDTSLFTYFYRDLKTLVSDAEDRLEAEKIFVLYTFIEPQKSLFVVLNTCTLITSSLNTLCNNCLVCFNQVEEIDQFEGKP